MKELKLLVWLTQLGVSVAFPLVGFVLLGVWLRNHFGLGVWVILCGCAIGLICAIDGFKNSMKIMMNLGKNKKEEKQPTSFNDHE